MSPRSNSAAATTRPIYRKRARGARLAVLVQRGEGNALAISQDGGAGVSGVAALQLGERNSMSLIQLGDDNSALLTQNGSDNAMSAVQNGGNHLTWIQNGSGLSNLQINQPVGQTMIVTQTR